MEIITENRIKNTDNGTRGFKTVTWESEEGGDLVLKIRGRRSIDI